MAARVSTIWFVDNNDVRAELSLYPQPDQAAALAIAQRLHPGKEFESLGPHPLSIAATVQPGYLFIGTYENISVVASAELSACLPSELPESWLLSPHAPLTFLVSSSPDRAQGSFAIWENGQLRRSFSALPIDIVENIGIPQTWELPYWSGKHPLRYPPGILPDPQALPFHPQQFAEAANAEWLGFRYTGAPHEGDLDKTQILLWGFKIHQKSEAPKATVPTTEQPEQAEQAEQAQQARPKPQHPNQLRSHYQLRRPCRRQNRLLLRPNKIHRQQNRRQGNRSSRHPSHLSPLDLISPTRQKSPGLQFLRLQFLRLQLPSRRSEAAWPDTSASTEHSGGH